MTEHGRNLDLDLVLGTFSEGGVRPIDARVIAETAIRGMPRRPAAERLLSSFQLSPTMAAATAAAVVVSAILGLMLFGAPSPNDIGTAPPAVGASPSAAASPTLGPPPQGPIEPGRYRDQMAHGDMTFDVPEGWFGSSDGLIKGLGTPDEVRLTEYLPGNPPALSHVYGDACAITSEPERIDLTVGAFVTALENQKGTDSITSALGTRSDVGRRIELRKEAGLDRSECRLGSSGPLQIWVNEFGNRRFDLEPGEWAVVYAFDTADGLTVAAATFGREATEADVAEVDAIISSIEFSSPSRSASPGPAE